MSFTKNDLKKISDYLWEIPKDYRSDMRVPARVFANEKLLDELFKDRSLEQLVNVATLPGIQKWALSMPDIHEGYGFPIGGVAAMDAETGVISPGGIGYDINCSVTLLRSPVTYEEIKDKISQLSDEIYKQVPSGVGRGGRVRLSTDEFNSVLKDGAPRMIEAGYGFEEDLEHRESKGRLEDTEPSLVSKTAKDRGRDQLGTIGAGNHFVEVQRVDEIFDKETARSLGLFPGQVVIMFHCGSRGLGHQVATDYIRVMMRALPKYGITLADPELACAPFKSAEGSSYWQAMSAAANFGFANHQMITWEVRQAWEKVFGKDSGSQLSVVYQVAHNLAKLEEHFDKKVIVHRKGATRAFPDQPVLIPGSMGTASYVLVGVQGAMELSFGSSCHGAGRMMSRTRAKREVRGSVLKQDLEKQGIAVRSGSMSGLAEEAPVAYKDVEAVVEAVDGAGLAKKVARLRPVAVIKG